MNVVNEGEAVSPIFQNLIFGYGLSPVSPVAFMHQGRKTIILTVEFLHCLVVFWFENAPARHRPPTNPAPPRRGRPVPSRGRYAAVIQYYG